LPLVDGRDAFAARIALIRGAEQALDVQYYIWHRDATGLILLEELRRAAERGVRIRLLLDDNGISGLDGELAALDALPDAEIRLFNPFILRNPKALGFTFDFFRLNRRMHNKSLTADGAVSILGGRNVGDIYFAFGEGVHYLDADVLVAGEAAAAVGADFDRYWASRSAHPADRILSRPEEGALARLTADAEDAAHSAEGRAYAERLRASNVVNNILSGQATLEWTTVTLVSDDPAKGLGEAAHGDILFPQLMALVERPARSVDLVSAYFIPGQEFTEGLAELAASGRRVRILTNSQDATDVMLVHSAYVNYRPDLVRAGVELYELKPAFSIRDEPEADGLAGPSRASLHSKTLAIDGERIFIGSFNFDPRSLFLNTEMGVLIDSPRMAAGLAGAFAEIFPVASYRPEPGGDGSLVWVETGPDGTRLVHAEEPGSSPASRLLLSVLGLLPIEWLL
jgi:putative cardiolipin synthase